METTFEVKGDELLLNDKPVEVGEPLEVALENGIWLTGKLALRGTDSALVTIIDRPALMVRLAGGTETFLILDKIARPNVRRPANAA